MRDLVVCWHERAQREDDYVSKFVFLWFCFNAWLAYESDQDSDRRMIDWLKAPHARKSQLRIAFNQASRSKQFTYCSELLFELSPIADGAGRRPNVHIESAEGFEGIVEGVYRVRCNLFHGNKDPNSSRDEDLVRACGQILVEWIGSLVSSWN